MSKKTTRIKIMNIIREAVDEAKSAPMRDAFTGGQDTNEVANPDQLVFLLTNENYDIARGRYANLTYLSEAEIKKGYNKDGYTDSSGKFHDFDSIESQGRALNKKYINDIYDSDKYRARDFRQRVGLQRNFGVIEVTTLEVNWGAMTYGKNKERCYDAIRNASDDAIRQYVHESPNFAKRFEKYCTLHPELADKLATMRDQDALDRDTIVDIYKTPLKASNSEWRRHEHSKYLSVNDKTQTKGLRMTQTSVQTNRAENKYFMVRDNNVYRITDDEYFQIRRMFASTRKPTTVVHTELGDLLDAISGECQFRDRDISKVLRLSFKLEHKPSGTVKDFTYENNEIKIPGLDHTLRYYDLMNAPLAESRRRRRYKKIQEAYNKRKPFAQIAEMVTRDVVRQLRHNQ